MPQILGFAKTASLPSSLFFITFFSYLFPIMSLKAYTKVTSGKITSILIYCRACHF